MNLREGDGVGGEVVGDRESGHAGAGDGQRIELVQARCGIAQEELVFIAEVVIEAEAALIVIVDADLGGFINLVGPTLGSG